MTKEMEERLSKANDLREQEKYGEAMRAYTECLISSIKDKEPEGLVHALGGTSLVYKIKARETGEKIYKNLTTAFASESYKVAEENKETLDGRTLSIAYRSYADALLMEDKANKALPIFEKAFEISTADKCEKGSLKAHIGTVKYLLGMKEDGIKVVKEGLLDIRTGDMNQYAPRVWETGALNSLAKIYAEEGQWEMALESINESLKIAKEYNLTIRLREAGEILAKIEMGEMNFGI